MSFQEYRSSFSSLLSILLYGSKKLSSMSLVCLGIVKSLRYSLDLIHSLTFLLVRVVMLCPVRGGETPRKW